MVGRRMLLVGGLAVLIVVSLSALIFLVVWPPASPSQWVKVGECGLEGLEDWQRVEVYMGGTWGTIFIQARWKAPFPADMYEGCETEAFGYSVYNVYRRISVLLIVGGAEYRFRLIQGSSRIWVFEWPGIAVVHESFNATTVTLGLRLSPPPYWFAPLSSVQSVRINSTFFIHSSADSPYYLEVFPRCDEATIEADGLIGDWVEIDNLTLACAPVATKGMPGAIVNASAVATSNQLAFMIACSQPINATRNLYPELNFSASFYVSVGWYTPDDLYYGYGGNFYLDDGKENVIIYVHDVPGGWYVKEEFSVEEDQWAVGEAFEWYLTASQAEAFFRLYPAVDYSVHFSLHLGWTYGLSISWAWRTGTRGWNLPSTGISILGITDPPTLPPGTKGG